MTLHLSPQSIGAGFQTGFAPGRVTVHGVGDTLTMAGLLAVAKAIGTYFGGVSGGTILAGYPTTTPAGGAPPLPSVITLTPSLIQVGCKTGDEVALLNSMVTAITTGGNNTATGVQKAIPGPVWGTWGSE